MNVKPSRQELRRRRQVARQAQRTREGRKRWVCRPVQATVQVAGPVVNAAPAGLRVRRAQAELTVKVKPSGQQVFSVVPIDPADRHRQKLGGGYYRMGGSRKLTSLHADWVPDETSRSRRHYVNGFSDRV